MLQYFGINQKPAQFGRLPDEGTVVYSIEINSIPIPYHYQGLTREFAVAYLKKLVEMMHEDAFVLYNGEIVIKQDINLNV